MFGGQPRVYGSSYGGDGEVFTHNHRQPRARGDALRLRRGGYAVVHNVSWRAADRALSPPERRGGERVPGGAGTVYGAHAFGAAGYYTPPTSTSGTSNHDHYVPPERRGGFHYWMGNEARRLLVEAARHYRKSYAGQGVDRAACGDVAGADRAGSGVRLIHLGINRRHYRFSLFPRVRDPTRSGVSQDPTCATTRRRATGRRWSSRPVGSERQHAPPILALPAHEQQWPMWAPAGAPPPEPVLCRQLAVCGSFGLRVRLIVAP